MSEEFNFPFPISPHETGGGRIVSFLGIKSGAGASTLACMAAISLSKRYETALVDFNPESKVRSYMGFPVDVSTSSILDIAGIRNEESVINAGELVKNSNIRLFPGIVKPLDCLQLSAALHQRACLCLKQFFPHTIVVQGPVYAGSWAGLLISDLICLVVTPCRTVMDSYHEYIELLGRMGVVDRTVIIVNKAGYPGALEYEGSKRFFSPVFSVPYARRIAEACNRRNMEPGRDLERKFRRLLLDRDSLNASGTILKNIAGQ